MYAWNGGGWSKAMKNLILVDVIFMKLILLEVNCV